MLFLIENSRLNKLIGFPRYDRKIASLTVVNGTYTATEDCWCIGIIKQNDVNNGASVSINSIIVCGAYVAGSSDHVMRIMVPVKKGDTVTTRSYGIYDLEFYGV